MTTSVKCENCGGSINLSLESPISFCPYCGRAIKRDETTMDELRLKLQHEKFLTEEKNRKEKEDFKHYLLLLLIMILLIMALTIQWPSK